MSWMLWNKCVTRANICKQWTKVITIIVSSNEQFCWIYLNYLTLRSKDKVPQRSLRYATYHIMVMHPHTKYHWSISKDKNVMARRRKWYLKNHYLTLRSKVKLPRRKFIMVHDTQPYGHAPTNHISLNYLERQKYYGPD